MTDYAGFFLNSSSSVVQLDLIEIYHPSFSQTYWIVRNYVNGVTVTLEDSTVQEFIYYPLAITSIGTREDLDYGIRIDLGDLGEILPKELDLVAEAGTYEIAPTVRHRTYRSDDLSAPLFGPVKLEASNFSFTSAGASFEAKAPSLNTNKTGELYKIDRFPMLRGFL